jgi:glutamyl-Q tRNA(Asp) synthetase
MPTDPTYTGRFAPSPTGPLHFGSLIGALASFLDARAHGGRWLVRIEDIDPPREMPGAAAAILRCLRAHGLEWDGEVLYQSGRGAAYAAALERLLNGGAAFYCNCSRTSLANGGIHTGHCRGRRQPPAGPCAVRLQVADTDIAFDDAIQGRCRQNPAQAGGDFVIFRKEKLAAYQLAVVVDDAAQGVTHVVRGSDLLDSTARQIVLQRQLGNATPHYAHVPVICNGDGQKLSKQTGAAALDDTAAADNLRAALDFLGQPPPAAARAGIGPLLQWAAAHWDRTRIPRCISRGGAALPPSCRRFAS